MFQNKGLALVCMEYELAVEHVSIMELTWRRCQHLAQVLVFDCNLHMLSTRTNS